MTVYCKDNVQKLVNSVTKGEKIYGTMFLFYRRIRD